MKFLRKLFARKKTGISTTQQAEATQQSQVDTEQRTQNSQVEIVQQPVISALQELSKQLPYQHNIDTSKKNVKVSISVNPNMELDNWHMLLLKTYLPSLSIIPCEERDERYFQALKQSEGTIDEICELACRLVNMYISNIRRQGYGHEIKWITLQRSLYPKRGTAEITVVHSYVFLIDILRTGSDSFMVFWNE